MEEIITKIFGLLFLVFTYTCCCFSEGNEDAELKNFLEKTTIEDRFINKETFLELKKRLKEIQEQLKVKPADYKLYYQQQFVYFDLAQTDNAFKTLLKVIEVNPAFADAYKLLAYYYSLRNEHEKVLESYDKAIELNPKMNYLNFDAGTYCRNVIKNYDKAIEYFKKCLCSRIICGMRHIYFYL